MRRHLIVIAALLSLFSPAAQAANSTVSAMTAASALGGTDLLYVVQGAADRKGTPAQFATYIYGLASGDCTISGVGAVVCTKTNGVAFGALATATPGTGVATALGVNVGTAGAPVVNGGALGTPSSGTLTSATGLPISTGVSGLGASVAAFLATPSSANFAAAVTGGTGTGANVFGTAPTISSLNATTAATLAFITGSTQCLQVNTSGAVSGTGAACGGSGSTGANPTATAADTAVNGSATTFMRSDGAPAVQKASSSAFGVVKVDGATIVSTAGVISFNAPINAQVGTTYTVLSTDLGKIITLTNSSPIAVTVPIASTSGFGAPFYTSISNQGAGVATLTPTTSTIDGGSSLTLKQGQSVDLVTDGTNYFTLRGRPTNVACADLTNGTALCSTTPGTGVATAAAANLSAAGGLTSTIASGTSAMGTGAITSATCATVVTTTATNTATTDVVTASFNGDPTAVTGYIPATAGMLTIIAYPTSGNVNFKVCNNTSASITPGAITLNWRVVR
jgi:hypothetical protein